MPHATTSLTTPSSRGPFGAASPSPRVQLDHWLNDARMPSDSMDRMTLEGFLTAIVVGPATGSREDWLPRVWGARRRARRAPACLQEPAACARFRALVLQYLAEIAEQFDQAPETFQPTFCAARFGGVEATIADPWCIGFVARMNMQSSHWRPLRLECPDLLRPLLLYGTRPGWEERHSVPDPAAFHAEWWPQIAPAVHGIHRYWLARNHASSDRAGGHEDASRKRARLPSARRIPQMRNPLGSQNPSSTL